MTPDSSQTPIAEAVDRDQQFREMVAKMLAAGWTETTTPAHQWDTQWAEEVKYDPPTGSVVGRIRVFWGTNSGVPDKTSAGASRLHKDTRSRVDYAGSSSTPSEIVTFVEKTEPALRRLKSIGLSSVGNTRAKDLTALVNGPELGVVSERIKMLHPYGEVSFESEYQKQGVRRVRVKCSADDWEYNAQLQEAFGHAAMIFPNGSVTLGLPGSSSVRVAADINTQDVLAWYFGTPNDFFFNHFKSSSLWGKDDELNARIREYLQTTTNHSDETVLGESVVTEIQDPMDTSVPVLPVTPKKWSPSSRLTQDTALAAFEYQFRMNDLAFVKRLATDIEAHLHDATSVFDSIPPDILWFHGGTARARDLYQFDHARRYGDGSYTGPGIYFTPAPLEAAKYASIKGGNIVATALPADFRLLRVPSRLNHSDNFSDERRVAEAIGADHYLRILSFIESKTGMSVESLDREGEIVDAENGRSTSITVSLLNLLWRVCFNGNTESYLDYLSEMADGVVVFGPKRIPNLIVFRPEVLHVVDMTSDPEVIALASSAPYKHVTSPKAEDLPEGTTRPIFERFDDSLGLKVYQSRLGYDLIFDNVRLVSLKGDLNPEELKAVKVLAKRVRSIHDLTELWASIPHAEPGDRFRALLKRYVPSGSDGEGVLTESYLRIKDVPDNATLYSVLFDENSNAQLSQEKVIEVNRGDDPYLTTEDGVHYNGLDFHYLSSEAALTAAWELLTAGTPHPDSSEKAKASLLRLALKHGVDLDGSGCSNHSDNTVLGEAEERPHPLNSKCPLYCVRWNQEQNPVIRKIVKVLGEVEGMLRVRVDQPDLGDSGVEFCFGSRAFESPEAAVEDEMDSYRSQPEHLTKLIRLRDTLTPSNHSDETVLGESTTDPFLTRLRNSVGDSVNGFQPVDFCDGYLEYQRAIGPSGSTQVLSYGDYVSVSEPRGEVCAFSIQTPKPGSTADPMDLDFYTTSDIPEVPVHLAEEVLSWLLNLPVSEFRAKIERYPEIWREESARSSSNHSDETVLGE